MFKIYSYEIEDSTMCCLFIIFLICLILIVRYIWFNYNRDNFTSEGVYAAYLYNSNDNLSPSTTDYYRSSFQANT